MIDDRNGLESGIFVRVSVASDWEDRPFLEGGTSAIFGVIVFLQDDHLYNSPGFNRNAPVETSLFGIEFRAPLHTIGQLAVWVRYGK